MITFHQIIDQLILTYLNLILNVEFKEIREQKCKIKSKIDFMQLSSFFTVEET